MVVGLLCISGCVFSQRHRRRERARETSVSCSKSFLHPSLRSLLLSVRVPPVRARRCWRRRVAGGGRSLPSSWPRLPSGVHTLLKRRPVGAQTHFFLLDFSERLPPRSDLSDLSPLSFSFSSFFSFSFSFSFSARSMRSARSERSPPRSDLLSALLPSRRVPSSVDEVVGWG